MHRIIGIRCNADMDDHFNYGIRDISFILWALHVIEKEFKKRKQEDAIGVKRTNEKQQDFYGNFAVSTLLSSSYCTHAVAAKYW